MRSARRSRRHVPRTASLGEWHLPVSPQLGVDELTLLAASCRSLGCRTVVFAYRVACGRPLPQVPSRATLAAVARRAALDRALLRADIEDVALGVDDATRSMDGLRRFLARVGAQFDIVAVLLGADPSLLEGVDLAAAFAGDAGAQLAFPVILNVDGCSGAMSLPRRRVPPGAVVELSYSMLLASGGPRRAVGAAPQATIQALRQLLVAARRHRVLCSCGGPVIGAADVDAAAVTRAKSQVDAACLAEALCGRRDLLATNKRLCVAARAAAVKAAAAKADMARSRRREAAVALPVASRGDAAAPVPGKKPAAAAISAAAAAPAAPATRPRRARAHVAPIPAPAAEVVRLDSAVLAQLLVASRLRRGARAKQAARHWAGARAGAKPARPHRSHAADALPNRRRPRDEPDDDGPTPGPAVPPSTSRAPLSWEDAA
jgi:hypothetical protein